MRKNNKIIVLLIILLVLVAFAATALVYDNNERVIARTTGLVLGDGFEVERMNKHGFVFRRAAYEAKISVPHDNPMIIPDAMNELYGEYGNLLSYTEFSSMYEDLFSGYKIAPKVEYGTNAWVMGVNFDTHESIFLMVVSEDPEHAYLYIYYSRY